MPENLLKFVEKSFYENQAWFVGSRIGVVGLVVAAILALSACTNGDNPPTPPATSESPSSAPATERVVGPLTPADSQALATMNDRLRQYLDLRTKIERSLEKLPKEATPQQIDKNQRAMEKLALSGFPHSFLSAPSNSAANSNLLTLG